MLVGLTTAVVTFLLTSLVRVFALRAGLCIELVYTAIV